MSVKTVGDRPAGHDLVVVIGAEVFRYYPYVPGPYLSDGTEFLQITGNPAVAAAALMGDSLLGGPGAIEQPLDMGAGEPHGALQRQRLTPGSFPKHRTARLRPLRPTPS
jgi:benzoylformate decarboxylase